jgi:hypothetical protein
MPTAGGMLAALENLKDLLSYTPCFSSNDGSRVRVRERTAEA